MEAGDVPHCISCGQYIYQWPHNCAVKTVQRYDLPIKVVDTFEPERAHEWRVGNWIISIRKIWK